MSGSCKNSGKDAQQSVVLRAAEAADAAPLAAIYNLFITDTVVTFEIEPITEAEMYKTPVVDYRNDAMACRRGFEWRNLRLCVCDAVEGARGI